MTRDTEGDFYDDLMIRVVLKNTAEAVLIPLKGGVSSLNEVYKALIEADVDPVTGKCSNYDYIRQQIEQAHQLLKQSEQQASSGLKSLDENLERLIQEEGKLKQEINYTILTLDNFRKEKESNENLLRVSQGALEETKRKLNSAINTLQAQEKRKRDAEIITGVGAGLLVIPIIGWIAGSAMIISGAVELDQANKSVQVAQEEVRKSENEVRNYEMKVYHYVSKISQTEYEISQKNVQLNQTREGIEKVKKQSQSVAEFQGKVRGAVNLLGVLRGRVSVAEGLTRRSILQEPVMKVMEDVMKSIEQITGNELLYRNDLPRLINQMKENNQRLAAICA
ncbi:centrosomal protein of 112 kDa-like isoform X1 [Tachysurus fulvidraco]|uniref:centrosomal protein of 112 kDa-like isoform X1 n=1 Tax=Tachysurus fulvidraco TaxID=1234273 RepID=UPI000F510A5C|nr:centrosomal protein of 112 kDa-like isoform X1 [Tachysurus fulvidraco]